MIGENKMLKKNLNTYEIHVEEINSTYEACYKKQISFPEVTSYEEADCITEQLIAWKRGYTNLEVQE